jgi:myo-inositol 2-dehydrogenase/D-chiro-inositol 1-dehydrogenase
MISIAVIGCGRIGRMHAANVARHPGARLTAVYDVVEASSKSVAEETGARAAASLEEVLDAGDVDALLVASLTETHADLIERGAKAGKAVLCEKPIDLDIKRVDRCAEAIQGLDVPIQIGFNRRFDPGHSAVRAAAAAGEIGDLHQVIITSRDPGMPSRDYIAHAGGLLRDMTIHDFDMARFMLMEEPVEVFAVAEALIDPELGRELDDVDTAMIVLRTESGKMCCINNSRTSVYGYDQRVELMGTHGMLISDNRRPHELRRSSGEGADVGVPYLNFFVERYAEAFMNELSAFVDAVEGRAPVAVGFEDGRKALILAEAAYRSLASGRAVNLSELAEG